MLFVDLSNAVSGGEPLCGDWIAHARLFVMINGSMVFVYVCNVFVYLS